MFVSLERFHQVIAVPQTAGAHGFGLHGLIRAAGVHQH